MTSDICGYWLICPEPLWLIGGYFLVVPLSFIVGKCVGEELSRHYWYKAGFRKGARLYKPLKTKPRLIKDGGVKQ